MALIYMAGCAFILSDRSWVYQNFSTSDRPQDAEYDTALGWLAISLG
jgi:hypothetical protein